MGLDEPGRRRHAVARQRAAVSVRDGRAGGESGDGPAPPGVVEPLRAVARPLWTPRGQPAGEHRVPTEGTSAAPRARLEPGRASDRRRDAPARAGDSEFAGLWR